MAPDVAKLLAELQQLTSSLVPNKESVREELLHAAQQLVRSLETPAERILRLGWHETTLPGTIRVLIDLNIFKLLAESDKPQKVPELATISGADPKLLARLLKHAATEDFVREVGPDEYVASDITRALASPAGEGAMKDVYQIIKVVDDFPTFLKETKYANPIDNTHSAFQHAYKTDQHFFTYVHSSEERFLSFQRHMEFKTIGLNWYEDKAVVSGILGTETFSDNDVIMVDVGGAGGHELLGFKKAHPDLHGRLILQDLPNVIDAVDSKALAAAGVEAMSHDMLTPQPIQHAKLYHLKMVLHDWPVSECRQALENLKPAMKAGYSRILLNEVIIPDVNASWFETSLDALMMLVHAGQERREWEWKELIESVPGLKLKKVWNVQGALEKVIEIDLA